MTNPLENKAKTLWRDYTDESVFWDQYDSIIAQAKTISTPKKNLHNKQHNTPTKLSIAQAYQQLPVYDYKISTTNYCKPNNVSYKKILSSSFFVVLAIHIPFTFILLILTETEDRYDALMGFPGSLLFFFITTVIVRVAWIGFAPESVDDHVYITFKEDCLLYRTEYTNLPEVIMYAFITQVDWQENGKVIITDSDDGFDTTKHTLAYPIDNTEQAQAIKDLLTAAQQNNFFKNPFDCTTL
ncbi:hypothetical protein [uncultured Microscilla sp.]|uniref:hypothetical protein n=1 Tax=uncultured Microscilla sp. TaxID=432653 RepID=UPI0026350511|nr:hypothetical protein [uncultured Microscilla sp.]